MTDTQLRDMEECTRFLELVRIGVGPLNAGLEVGWSPAKTRRMMKQPEFADLVADANDQLDENIQAALARAAQNGNMTAIQMWLYNRKPDEWRDVKRIEVHNQTEISIGVVASVKQAAAELLREHGPKALQPGGFIDAEVVDE